MHDNHNLVYWDASVLLKSSKAPGTRDVHPYVRDGDDNHNGPIVHIYHMTSIHRNVFHHHNGDGKNDIRTPFVCHDFRNHNRNDVHFFHDSHPDKSHHHTTYHHTYLDCFLITFLLDNLFPFTLYRTYDTFNIWLTIFFVSYKRPI